LFVRAQDIPEFVADGAADAGITGWDLVAESGRPLSSRLDLAFGRCTMVVAVRDDSRLRSVDDIVPGTRVATVFPNITRAFFVGIGRPVEIVPVSGAVEIAPHLGIADVIVDLTSTGSTLKVNGLRPVATILESSARLVAASEPLADPARSRALDELVMAVESVLIARTRRYVMANVPRARLDDVRRILPGISGPTVIDVMNGGAMVAVHAVAPADAIFRTIADLKAIGGEGILVTRIERLMP
jgi:ATP phosphoribosyltransferase